MKVKRKKTLVNKTKSKIKFKNPFRKLFKEKVEKKDDKKVGKKNQNKKQSTKQNKKQNTNVKNNKTKKNNKPKRKLWKKLLTLFLILCIMAILGIAIFLGYVVLTAPEFDEEAFETKEQTLIYDKDGNLITKIGAQNREKVYYDQLPQVLIDAIVATEDSRFYQHNGVDLPRFIKATIQQLSGTDAGGASTLTMQIVKNNLTKQDKQEKNFLEKIVRKFQDVYLAVFKVEKNFSKEEILEFYVNNYYLGGSAYGVEEASKSYFNKSVSELTLPEAALIAGLFQSPSKHSPFVDIDKATSRRETVLKLMERHGYITKEEREIANSISIESLLNSSKLSKTEYQGFIDQVVNEVEDITKELYGDEKNPYLVPMKIYTTMDREIQDGINKIMNSDSSSYWADEYTKAGIAVVEADTGAIAALGADRNISGERQFSFATDAKRQPGSTAKPIFSYGPLFEYNNASTYNLIVDEPWSYTNGPQINNWDRSYNGLGTLRTMLSLSRNVPALKSFQSVSLSKIQSFAYSLGLDVSLNKNSDNYRIVNEYTGLDNTINQAYSIGGVAEGFSPLEMAGAYAAFASMGYYTEPYSVTKIEFRETGETYENKPTRKKVMKESTAYMINNVLEYAVNINWDGGAKIYGSHVAAKTGTSNYTQELINKYHISGDAVNDLWTVAYTSKYSVAVWYGYKEFDSSHYNRNGNNTRKAAVTNAVMKLIPKDTKGWTMPSSVVQSKVEMGTWPAKLPSDSTPADKIVTEYFLKGTQPNETSEWYQTLNDVENLKVSMSNNTATITWDYTRPKQYTEDYIKHYFEQNPDVWGNSIQKFTEEKINQYKNIQFIIYEQDTEGILKQIDVLKETQTSYTYTPTKDTTLVIKVKLDNYDGNISNGVSTKISTTTQQETPKETLTATMSGSSNVSVVIGTYKDNGIVNVKYGTKDVTSDASINYQLVYEDGNIIPITTLSELNSEINKLNAGTYKINFIIQYQDKQLIKTRKVTLRNSTSSSSQ